jgi:hypothetical protein
VSRDPRPTRRAAARWRSPHLCSRSSKRTGCRSPVCSTRSKRLAAQVTSSHAFVDEAARYLIDAGGKRFRPLLVALTGHLGDPDRPELVDAGVIVELVHLATLYHDDVIDEAPRAAARRRRTRGGTTRSRSSPATTCSRAHRICRPTSGSRSPASWRAHSPAVRRPDRRGAGSIGALPPEVPQLEATRAHYLEVISGKTASLIETSCRYGALLSGVDDDGSTRQPPTGGTSAWRSSSPTTCSTSPPTTRQSGKTPGTDLREGVRTLPVLIALEDDPTVSSPRAARAQIRSPTRRSRRTTRAARDPACRGPCGDPRSTAPATSPRGYVDAAVGSSSRSATEPVTKSAAAARRVRARPRPG